MGFITFFNFISGPCYMSGSNKPVCREKFDFDNFKTSYIKNCIKKLYLKNQLLYFLQFEVADYIFQTSSCRVFTEKVNREWRIVFCSDF